MKRLACFGLVGILLCSVADAQFNRRTSNSNRQRSNVRSGQRSVPAKALAARQGVRQHFTRSRSFNIPFNLEPGAKPKEVQLYYAINGGPWKFYARQDPRRASRFRFRTVQDGEYWFATKTVEGDRRVQPSGLLKPELQVVIDTERPTIKMDATVGEDGQLRLGWTITDNRELDLRGMIIEVH